jgi:hypothetical protein
MELRFSGTGGGLRTGNGGFDVPTGCASPSPVIQVLVPRRNNMKDSISAARGDVQQPLFPSGIILAKRIHDGTRRTKTREQSGIARPASGNEGGVIQGLDVVL